MVFIKLRAVCIESDVSNHVYYTASMRGRDTSLNKVLIILLDLQLSESPSRFIRSQILKNSGLLLKIIVHTSFKIQALDKATRFDQ